MDKIRLAGCAILDPEGLLLLHRIKKQWYELPGGKIRIGDTLESTARRELLEELSVDVRIDSHIGTRDFHQDGYVMEYNWFLATVINGVPKIGEPELYDHFKKIPLSSLREYQLSPNMESLLTFIEEGNYTWRR